MANVKFPALGQLLSCRCSQCIKTTVRFLFHASGTEFEQRSALWTHGERIFLGEVVKSSIRWLASEAALSSTPSTGILALFVQQPASNRHQLLAHPPVPLSICQSCPAAIGMWAHLSSCPSRTARSTVLLQRCGAANRGHGML
jgi:hypothetical protein